MNVTGQNSENFLYQKLLRPIVFGSRLGRKVIFGHVGRGSFVDYVYKSKGSGYTRLGALVDAVLLRLPAAKATRRKMEQICGMLQDEIERNLKANRMTKIVDIGSGPARYLVEVTRGKRKEELQAICLDIDKTSLKYGRRIGKDCPVEYRFGDLKKMVHYRRLSERIGWRPNIAVVATSFDFVDDGAVRKSLEEIYKCLEPGGILLVVSQADNPSRSLLENLTLFHKRQNLLTRYRKPPVIKRWMTEAGFKNISIRLDKWGMYSFCRGVKIGTASLSDIPPRIFLRSMSYTRASQQRSTNMYQYMRGFQPSPDGMFSVNNKRKLIIMATNDYLGLRNRREVIESTAKAVREFGTSTASSRILTGNFDIHEELQEKISEFLGTEDALLFSTGYMANMGVVSQLATNDDVVILDRNSHASLLDGCKLSGATARYFLHNNLEDLERILCEYSENVGRLIVCDGVYSMEGDVAPLPDIIGLAERYHIGVAIDDGHATGVLGKNGRGTLEHFNLSIQGKGCVIIGSLGKALVSVGGFVAGDRIIIDYLRHTSRPLLFSTSLCPANAATALEALRIIQREPWLIQRLWSNTSRMKDGLRNLGYRVGNSETPIIPVIIGEENLVYKMTLALQELNVIVDGVGPPGVKRNQCRLRIRVSAAHDDEDINGAITAFKKVGQQVGVI